jgi:hypothetical protein
MSAAPPVCGRNPVAHRPRPTTATATSVANNPTATSNVRTRVETRRGITTRWLMASSGSWATSPSNRVPAPSPPDRKTLAAHSPDDRHVHPTPESTPQRLLGTVETHVDLRAITRRRTATGDFRNRPSQATCTQRLVRRRAAPEPGIVVRTLSNTEQSPLADRSRTQPSWLEAKYPRRVRARIGGGDVVVDG